MKSKKNVQFNFFKSFFNSPQFIIDSMMSTLVTRANEWKSEWEREKKFLNDSVWSFLMEKLFRKYNLNELKI